MSADIEQQVIGALLLDERYMPDVMKRLDADDFHDGRLGAIYAGLRKMREQGEPIDVLTVSPKLTEWRVRGVEPVDLHVWVGEVITAANVGFYAEQVAAAAMGRGVVEVATQVRDAADAPAEAIRLGVEGLQALQRKEAADEGKVYRLSDLLNHPVTHDWLIPGLIERQDRMILTGFEGLGKSALTRQLAYCTAAGVNPWREWDSIEPRRVLVLDAENTVRQWARNIRIMHERLGLSEARDTVEEHLAVKPLRRLDITKPRDLAIVHQYVDETNPDLLVIGPLYRLTPGAINSDDDAAPVLAALDTLRDRGLALVIEAHAGKADDGKGQRNLSPRGSSALQGWPEFGFGLRPAPKNSRHHAELVRWRGDREERLWPRNLVKGSTGLLWQIADETNT